jgi:tRNA(Arg) A34 adenosine deaminase TadA
MTNDSQFNHRPIVTGGILEKQCQEILRSFFRLRR